jgi:hypothetical protein
MEHATEKNRGFGFVEFGDEKDATEALEVRGPPPPPPLTLDGLH